MSTTTRDGDHGSWETITAALDLAVGPGRPSGAWTRYCCPAHEGDGQGHRPSLGVKYDSAQQRTVVRCFAGCDNEQVLDTLGLQVRDMFDRQLSREQRRGRRTAPRPVRESRSDRAIHAAGIPSKKVKTDLGEQVSAWKKVDTYAYIREDGTVAGEVIRREADFARGRDKKFSQRAWDTEKGWQDHGFDRIPYQLPMVLDAIEHGRTIYLVEGEKDVAAAESAGLTATTNAGGASAWSSEHAGWLRGARTVVIVADRDAPGYHRADRVMASLAGLVGQVRVVQAATGKDLTDHLQLGHEIAELDPIPGLDPYTPIPRAPVSAAADMPVTSPTPAAVTGPDTTHPPTPPQGGPPLGEQFLAPQLHGTHPDQTPDLDHMSSQWAQFMRLFLERLLLSARKARDARRAYDEEQARQDRAAREATQARIAAERAAVEARLYKLREAGYEKASRTEIAEALHDAVVWAPDSELARREGFQLANHVRQRYGVSVDIDGHDTGTARVVVSPDLAHALSAAEIERAAAARLRKAQERMVELVAATDGLEESTKEQLYAAIEAWRANPTAKQLDSLSRTLEEKGVGAPVRTRLRFVAAYLGTPDQVVPVDELGVTSSVSATTELRKLGHALVDPGEEAKPRIDELLVRYQDALRVGGPTDSVRERLSHAVAIMTPEDQQTARERGAAIRANPAGKYAPLWPKHVDRDELATAIGVYATLAPQAERSAGKAADLDDATAVSLHRQAVKHRKTIVAAIKGEGLHEWERDQIEAVLRDVEAGKTTTPELMWADDRSAAAVDVERAERIARATGYTARRQIEQSLESNAAPQGTVRRSRDALTRVMDAQTELAAGRASLPDYERTGLDRRLDAHLSAVGVPEPLRNRVRHQLDEAAGEAATVGKQANRIADRWAERREAVAISRDPAFKTPGYDSPERREELEKSLRAQGYDDDKVAQRMAADASFAAPPSAAAAAGKKSRGARTTEPGAGVRRTQHRRRGNEPEQGR